MTETPAPEGPRVGLFVTCLVDLFRPTVGFATVKLLERAGCRVEVPEAQTCCGQPGWNSGDRESAKRIARDVIAAFEPYDYVVAPSGSCAGTIAKDYPAMFAGEPEEAQARALAAKTWEIVSFLTDVRKVEATDAAYRGRVTYHDSCSGLRALGVKRQPRALLGRVEGLELREMDEAEVCCGFGGTFCVKFPDISDKMVTDKTRHLAATGAETLLAGDLGCLMNIAGKLRREGREVDVRHIVEVLAGMTDAPAIGRAKEDAA